MPECIVDGCHEPAVMRGNIRSRYCVKHLNGLNDNPLRKSFSEPLNKEAHGWRQADNEEFSIVTDKFAGER